jgi:hypothetical protein
MAKKSAQIITTQIQNMIYEIRGQKVMLDSDLAALYGVELRSLNQAVKRNIGRFPSDFMFQLTDDEWNSLRSQIVIFSKDTRKYKPYAFTEHGVVMLASVLNSKIATQVNIAVVNAIIDMRRYIAKKKKKKIDDLEKVLMLHIDGTNHNLKEHAAMINKIIATLNNLIEQPTKTKTIGFRKD